MLMTLDVDKRYRLKSLIRILILIFMILMFPKKIDIYKKYRM